MKKIILNFPERVEYKIINEKQLISIEINEELKFVFEKFNIYFGKLAIENKALLTDRLFQAMDQKSFGRLELIYDEENKIQTCKVTP